MCYVLKHCVNNWNFNICSEKLIQGTDTKDSKSFEYIYLYTMILKNLGYYAACRNIKILRQTAPYDHIKFNAVIS